MDQLLRSDNSAEHSHSNEISAGEGGAGANGAFVRRKELSSLFAASKSFSDQRDDQLLIL